MDSLSRNILSVLLPFSVLFSKPSWKKALTLLLGTLVCTGKRTVCSALRAMGLEYESGFSNGSSAFFDKDTIIQVTEN